jgi:hypothetical protein
MSRWGYVVLISVAGALALLVPGSASAYQDPPVKLGTQPQYLPDSTNYVAANSPRPIPGVDPPSTTGQSWYQALWKDSPEFDPEILQALRQESESLLKRAGRWAWERAPVLGRISAAAGSFYVGYQIGTKIYGLLHNDPGPPPSQAYFADNWQLVAPGQMLLSDATGNTYAPSWGVWEYSTNLQVGRITDPPPNCQNTLWGSGSPIYSPGWIAMRPGNYCGITRYKNYVLFKAGVPAECGVVADHCSGIQPQNYNGANQATVPTPQQLQTDTQTELNTGNYPLTNSFMNFLEDPENFPDPRIRRTATNWNHDCDRAPGPSYVNADRNQNPSDPFTPYPTSPNPFPIGNYPLGMGYDGTPVYLRYGNAWWKPGRFPNMSPKYIDDWGGWGYRHIQAKHGWSEADRQETAQALAQAAPIPEDPNDLHKNWDYIIPVAQGLGGVSCERVVGVDFEQPGFDPPRGIVTSYNEVVP